MTILQRTVTVATAAALVLTPMAAFADTIEQHNSNTGNNSTNINRVRIRISNSTSNTRRATINNIVNFSGSTGGNSQHHNTTAGNVSSGDISFTLNIVNDVNNN